MKKILVTLFLFAVFIIIFEYPVNEFQSDNSLLCTKEVVSETVEKANNFSIDEEIIFPYSLYNDFFALINFISNQPENSLHNISYEILQPPR